MKNRYAFYGLRRSGNHAILEWLIQNLGGSGERTVISHRRLIAVNTAAYINEANTFEPVERLYKHCTYADQNYENLIVSYEDVSLDYILPPTKGYKNIVIVRDINNLFASRYKRFIDKGHLHESSDMLINEKIVNIWKDHVNAGLNKDAILIQFEKWLDSKEYRDEISAIFKCHNYDITDTMTEFGDGSSFSGKIKPSVNDLKNRANQIQLPEIVQERINQSDIVELRKKLQYID